MLQPLQLEEVSTRYPAEIADLREFLAKAGLSLDTPRSLSDATARLRADRAFRRDLTSHIWVVLHAGERQTGYPDLLGMLALATAGPLYAPAADDDDAHDLLRFLMEARGAFGSGPEARPHLHPNPRASAVSIAQSAPPAEAFATEPSNLRAQSPTPPTEPTFSFARHLETDPQQPDRRRWLVWAGAAAALLLAFFVGLWLHREPATDRAVSTPTTTPTATPSLNKPSPAIALSHEDAPLAQHLSQTPHSAARTSRRHAPTQPLRTPAAQPQPTFQGQPAPVTPVANIARALQGSSASLAPPTAAPSSVAKTSQPAIPRNPRLLRRPPASTSAANAARRPANPTSADSDPDSDGNSPAAAAHNATVHPISLGIMAANVTYSPAPLYPPAASAAHVEGEVKLEAEVDRDGEVVSTRVISGPPLLRDAAADALQRWRYRPYLYDGKPIAMNATVVMDFKLP